MTLEYEILKRQHPVFDKLLDYGFTQTEQGYSYVKSLSTLGFEARLFVDQKGQLRGGVYDDAFGDEYTNFRLRRKLGDFAAGIKKDYVALLEDIALHCYEEDDFICPQTNRIALRIKQELGDDVTRPFKDPSIGAFTHHQKKWYGLVMCIDRSKVTNGEGEIEILNVKLPPERIDELTAQPDYYRAYHMNKTHWLSVILDDSLADETIMDLIKTSYILTSGYDFDQAEKAWLVPANPRFYDIIGAFREDEEIFWKQSSDIHVGDIVYMYVGAPYSAILFKCVATQVNIPYNYEDANVRMRYLMKIKLIKTYPYKQWTLTVLKQYGVTTVRGPRYMPKALMDDMDQK